MRKVLFATTALVALGGVSAASADISVAGSASHNFVSGSGDGTYATDSQSMSTTVDFGLSGSNTLDNGMTVAGGIDLDEGGYDDSGWTLSGDFGTLAFGGYANDSFGAMSVDVTADEGHGGFTSTTGSTTEYVDTLPGDEYIGHSDISLALPAINGVSIAIGYGDGTTDDNNSSFGGISYAMDAGDMTVTVAYAKQSTGGSSADNDQMAAKIAAGDATVTMISGNKGDYSNTGIGVTYALSDSLTVQAYTGSVELDTNSAYEVKDTGFGATYTITPGLSMSLTSNSYSGRLTINCRRELERSGGKSP
jgi:hypothetical protein